MTLRHRMSEFGRSSRIIAQLLPISPAVALVKDWTDHLHSLSFVSDRPGWDPRFSNVFLL